MDASGTRSAWGSLTAGLGSIATLPLAVYLTRFSERYDLLHAGFAIPVGAALGIVSVVLARRVQRVRAVSLRAGRSSSISHAGRILGILGVCIALAGVVALVVYGLLEYAGTRD